MKTVLVDCVRVNKVTGEVVQKQKLDLALLRRIQQREQEYPKICEWKLASEYAGFASPPPATPLPSKPAKHVPLKDEGNS